MHGNMFIQGKLQVVLLLFENIPYYFYWNDFYARIFEFDRAGSPQDHNIYFTDDCLVRDSESDKVSKYS